MWLSAKDWSLLSLDGVNALPLSGFIAILELFFQQSAEIDPLEDPRNVPLDEILIWRFESGLCKLLNLDQVSLLTLGDRRQCTGRQAEAIMSALGATSWYKEGLRQVSPDNQTAFQARLEEGLMLGKYPIGFVREVCNTIPGDFFSSYIKIEDIFRNYDGGGVSQAHGSMLPFSETSDMFQSASAFRTESSRDFSETHSTVSTWDIRPSGHVHIREACVVSSSLMGLGQCSAQGLPIIAARTMPGLYVEEHNAPLPQDFQAVYGGGSLDYGDPFWFNLHPWIMRQSTATHAILTQLGPGSDDKSHEARLYSGIIIQEDLSGSLAKVFHFLFFDEQSSIDPYKVTTVDWLIR